MVPDPDGPVVGAPQAMMVWVARPWSRHHWSTVWRPAAAAAGLAPGTGAHVLRHYAASVMLARGVSVRGVQKVLGHSRRGHHVEYLCACSGGSRLAGACRVWTFPIGRVSRSCHGRWCRARRALVVGLLVADDPHAEELGAAAVRVAECLPGLERHLVVAGTLTHLLGDLAEADHPGSADRVRREHSAGRVPRDVPVKCGRARLGELPAVALGAEPEVLEPHGLVPRERHVDLGAVEVLAGS